MRLARPRIEPVRDDTATDEQRELLYERATPGEPVLNVFRTMAAAPKAARGFLAWGRYVLSKKNDLSPRDREIVILRTGWRCRSGYEWTQHKRIGLRSGLTESEIERLKQPASAAGWTEAERALIQAADELHDDQFISEETWALLSRHFTEKQRMDVVFTVGQYTQVSMFLNTFGVQLDDGQELDPDLRAY